MATLKFTYLLIKWIFFVKNNGGTSLIDDMFISYDKEYLIKKLPVPRSKRQSFWGQIMQCIFTYATGMYYYLFKITSEM